MRSVRLDPELEALVQRAAQCRGETVSEFLRLAAQARAEAELKAARADKEALSLRTEARELATAAAVDPIVASPQATNANGLGAVSADAPTVHQIDSNGINTTPLPGGNGGAVPTLQDLAPANVP